MSERWISGLVAVPLALTLATGASAQEEAKAKAEKKQMKEARVEVELEEKNDSGLTGVAVVEHAAEQEEGTIVLQIQGAEPGETYPAHIHAGTCAEPGSVVTALESPVQDEEGRATSSTVVTRADFEMKAGAEVAEREKTMEEDEGYAEARAEAAMAEEKSEKAGSYVIQVHLPGGTPAACGELPMKKHGEHGEKKKDR